MEIEEMVKICREGIWTVDRYDRVIPILMTTILVARRKSLYVIRYPKNDNNDFRNRFPDYRRKGKDKKRVPYHKQVHRT
jgi:hypothetical protein